MGKNALEYKMRQMVCQKKLRAANLSKRQLGSTKNLEEPEEPKLLLLYQLYACTVGWAFKTEGQSLCCIYLGKDASSEFSNQSAVNAR